MVKHIVMFKLKPFETKEAKNQKMMELKGILEGLTKHINVLKSAHVGFNINPKEEWDLVLECEFESFEDLQTYIVHPLHVDFGKNIMGPVKMSRACVDYEM